MTPGWIEILLGGLVALFAGLNIFQLFAFKSFKEKYVAEAEKAEAEASADKQFALERRLESIEKLYTEQGKVIDDLRARVLTLGQEKMERDEKIIKQEQTIKVLSMRVDELTKEVEAYRVITKK